MIKEPAARDLHEERLERHHNRVAARNTIGERLLDEVADVVAELGAEESANHSEVPLDELGATSGVARTPSGQQGVIIRRIVSHG